MNLEQTIQISSILTFIGAIVVFFIKLGEYKNATNNAIEFLKKNDEAKDIKIKELEDKIERVETASAQNSSRFEAILIEVKTKLELLISITGMFKTNGSENKRSKN